MTLVEVKARQIEKKLAQVTKCHERGQWTAAARHLIRIEQLMRDLDQARR